MDHKSDGIDFDDYGRVVGEKGLFIASELLALEPSPAAAVEADLEEMCVTLNSIVVNFHQINLTEDRQFPLTFRKTDTVKTAKIAVATRNLRGP
jgi:hypothetical protein